MSHCFLFLGWIISSWAELRYCNRTGGLLDNNLQSLLQADQFGGCSDDTVYSWLHTLDIIILMDSLFKLLAFSNSYVMPIGSWLHLQVFWLMLTLIWSNGSS